MYRKGWCLPSIGACRVSLLELGEEPYWFPAEPQGQVAGVHAQIVEDATLAAGGVLAFPVYRLFGIEVAGVLEGRNDFEDAPNGTGACYLIGTLASGVEGEFRGAADETFGFSDYLVDVPSGCEVDPKRLLGKQVFSRPQNIRVDLLVEVVGDGDVDYFDFRIGKDLMIVGNHLCDRRDALEPGEGFGVEIGDRFEDGGERDIGQGAPACKCGCDFATHEAAADDGYINVHDSFA